MKRNEPTFPPLPFYCSQARTSSPESVSALLLSKKENFSTFEQKPLDNFTAELKRRRPTRRRPGGRGHVQNSLKSKSESLFQMSSRNFEGSFLKGMEFVFSSHAKYWWCTIFKLKVACYSKSFLSLDALKKSYGKTGCKFFSALRSISKNSLALPKSRLLCAFGWSFFALGTFCIFHGQRLFVRRCSSALRLRAICNLIDVMFFCPFFIYLSRIATILILSLFNFR